MKSAAAVRDEAARNERGRRVLTEAEFRTDVLERGDRFAGWQQCMNHVIAPMEITSPHADDFWADYRLLRLEDTFCGPPACTRPATAARPG